MKAFTVYQPFAYAIVAGIKRYETRSRRTNIRGRVAVHAAAGAPYLIPKKDPVAVWAENKTMETQKATQRGAVIGTVEIVDCVPVEEVLNTLTDRERLLGDYSPGRFAWVLENPIIFDEPIPAKGQQGWWKWDE